MKEEIKKYAFKDGLPLEFEILDIDKRRKVKGDVMVVPHRAQFYHILWLEEGRGKHMLDFRQIELEDSCLLFIPSNCVNAYAADGIYKGKALLFTDSFFCRDKTDHRFLKSSILFSDLYTVPPLKIGDAHEDLRSFFKLMEKEFKKEKDYAQWGILQNLLHAFLLQAEREMRKQGFKEMKPSANLDYLLLFKDLLDENFMREKSVNKYASDLSITEKQLHKATTSLLDKTPKQIIDERVVLEAKRLLVHTSESVKEIAYSLGYDEPTNFIKYFRKHTQNTPSDFREQYT